MLTLKPQYITNDSGKKISVVLPIKDFKVIVEQLEELEDIRLYDAAKKSKEPSLDVDSAFKKLRIAVNLSDAL
jgi:hypothetical protein